MRLPILLAILATPIAAQTEPVALPKAEELLERTIAYHDPANLWSSRTIELVVDVTLSDRLAEARGYTTRKDRILVDIPAERFRYRTMRGEDRIEVIGEGESFRAILNRSEEISEEDLKTHRLGPDQLPGLRDYFTFLYGIPMKLRDPGTVLDPEVKRVKFAGRDVYALRVTYPPEVGSDVWYFYVHPVTYELTGCSFYHDEAANDGESIVFYDVVKGPDGLRLPKMRRWYRNTNGEYIAADHLVSVGVGRSLN